MLRKPNKMDTYTSSFRIKKTISVNIIPKKTTKHSDVLMSGYSFGEPTSTNIVNRIPENNFNNQYFYAAKPLYYQQAPFNSPIVPHNSVYDNRIPSSITNGFVPSVYQYVVPNRGQSNLP